MTAVSRKRRTPKDAVPAKQEWGQLGPAMRALPNDQWRNFCYALVTGADVHGKYSAAARAAGFGKDSTTTNLARRAHEIAHDDRMISAIAEMARKVLRAGHPGAVNAAHNIIRDPSHPAHGRIVLALLDRVDPVVSKQDISVVHRIVDPDQEALEELQALRQLGTPREKLLELFGGNGLARLERLEAADLSRRAVEAKLIEGEVTPHG